MTESALVCDRLSCGYHQRSILASIDLRFNSGQSVALLGPNGSGKSTFLKTISGAIPPISGSVTLENGTGKLDIHRAKTSAVAAQIAFVPQEEASLFPFTAREMVAMGRLARSGALFDTREDLEIAEASMERVGCIDLAGRPITELSGGEKQRVLIARAIAQETPIIFFDEPTSHLDPHHQVSVSELIFSLAESGKLVITAVHDLNAATLMAQHAVLVGDGKASKVSPIEELISDEALDRCYSTRFERLSTENGRLVVVPTGPIESC